MAATASPTSTNADKEAARKQQVTAAPLQEAFGPIQAGALPLAIQRAQADPGAARPAEILMLQRKYGNRAVQGLLDSHRLQAKLTVGAASDQYEQEADRVAAQVMTMPDSAPVSGEPGLQRQEDEEEVQTKPLVNTITRLVQRAPEEEEEIQTKRLVQRAPEEEEEIQTKRLVQRAPEEEEEIQTKRLVQRAPEEEEEVQTKPLVQRQQKRPGEEDEIRTKPLVQRQEDEEEIQTKRLVQRQQKRPGEEDEIRTKRVEPGAGFDASGTFEDRLRGQQGGGQPLPADTREFMESRFGADFSGVHVHADSTAVQLNRDVQAQAFTHGQDIFMGDGKYDPVSSDGRQLLAHELTHVVQQTGGVQRVLADTVQRVIDPEQVEWVRDNLQIFSWAHITQRHSPTSTATDAGKYDQATWGLLDSLIHQAVENAWPYVGQNGRWVFEYANGFIYGTDIDGGQALAIRVIVNPYNAQVVTAFPVR